MARAKKAAVSGRGSPEAIAKRRVARKLNALFTGAGSETPMDGRTAKRRQRLLTELDKGTRKGGKLKPIEILTRVNELYTLGEPSSAIRKVVHVRKASHIPLQQAAEILREIHAAYSFRSDSYRFLGLPHDALVAAKILSPDAPRRGRPPTKNRASR